MWPGHLHGYHREGDRTYVSGLSDILDTAAVIVAEHRAGQGGRFYVGAHTVECAECKSVLASIGREKSPAVSKRCVSP